MQLYGDFNLPKVDWLLGTTDDCDCMMASKASWFLTFINFSGLIQYNNLKNVAGNTLDIMLSNFCIGSLEAVTESLVNIDSFHPPFVVTFNATFYQRVLTSKLVYCYTKGNYFNLYKHVESYTWSEVYATSDADKAATELSTLIKEAIDQHIPKRQFISGHFPTWFSKELKTASCKKEMFHRRFKKTGLTVSYAKFRAFRPLVKKLTQRDKAMNERRAEHSLRSDPKSFWKYVHDHTRQSSHISLRVRTDSGTRHLPSSKEVADTFSSFFS